MSLLKKQALLFFALLLCASAFPQGVRYDVPPILNSRAVLVPNANISLCPGTATITNSTCSPASTQAFTDITLTTPCATGSPVVLPQTNVCSGVADALGNAGFWLSPGAYIYCITGPTITGKCYNLTVPMGSTTAGGGVVTINPFTFTNHNQFYWAGPGATPTIDTAAANCAASPAPCRVVISPGYTGPESVNLFTTSLGYKVYNNGNNVTIEDNRANPGVYASTAAAVASNVATVTLSTTSLPGWAINDTVNISGFSGADAYFNGSFVLTAVGTSTVSFALIHANASASSNGVVQDPLATPNYPIPYGGRLAGQLIRFGTNYYAHNALDSASANAAFTWIDGTLPPNSGQLAASINLITTHDTTTIGSAAPVLFTIDGEAYHNATTVDKDLTYLGAHTGQVGMSRTGAVGNIGTAAAYAAQPCANVSSTGKIENCYGIDLNKNLLGVAANYGVHNSGSELLESGSSIDFADAGFNISSLSEASTTVTVTTPATCNFPTGAKVRITGTGTTQLGYNGIWTVLTPGCNGGTTFTYTNTASGLASLGAGGIVAGIHGGFTVNPSAQTVDLKSYLDLNGWRFLANDTGQTAIAQIESGANGTGIFARSTIGCLGNGACFLGGTNSSVLGAYFDESAAQTPAAGLDVCGGNSTTHALQCSYNGGTVFNMAQVITATSAAFATATTAGTCVNNTTAVTGAATTMAVTVSPVSTPGVGAVWSAFVSSAGNVTINECAVATSAGGTIAFNIRVFP